MYKIPRCQSKLRITRHHCKLTKVPSSIENNIYNMDKKLSKFSNSYLSLGKDNSHSINNFRRGIPAPSALDKTKQIYLNEIYLNTKKNNSFSSIEKNTISTNSNSSAVYVNLESLNSKYKKDQSNPNLQILVNRKSFIENYINNSLSTNNEFRSIAKRYPSYSSLNISNPGSTKSNSNISNVAYMGENKLKKNKNSISTKPIMSINNNILL